MLSLIHICKNIKVDDKFLLSDNNITNIIGFAGQGKSTILRKILLESIKNGDKIPFFMELRKIEAKGIENSLLSIIEELGIKTDKKSLNSLLSSGNILLLLDGFDEISSKMRMDILSEIISLNRRHGCLLYTSNLMSWIISLTTLTVSISRPARMFCVRL